MCRIITAWSAEVIVRLDRTEWWRGSSPSSSLFGLATRKDTAPGKVRSHQAVPDYGLIERLGMTPIVGPIEKITESENYYSKSVGWKQKSPVDRPLPYFRSVCKGGKSGTSAAVLTASGWGSMDLINSGGINWNPVVGKARERLNNNISSRAAIGVNLATLSQTTQLIYERTTQLRRFVVALKRGRFGDAARILKMPTPRKVSNSKALASNYLAYHFGVEPLVKDVQAACDVLQSPVNDIWVDSSAKGTKTSILVPAPPEKLILTPYVNIQDESKWYPNAYNEVRKKEVSFTPKVKMGCQVAVTNPNLWLANQMGLINPFIVANEVIPFSFIADWFINLSQFLESGTEYLGLTLQNAWTTYAIKNAVILQEDTYQYKWTENGSVVRGGYTSKFSGVITQMSRQTGLASPGLYVRPFKIWGWRRAAAAASLLALQVRDR